MQTAASEIIWDDKLRAEMPGEAFLHEFDLKSGRRVYTQAAGNNKKMPRVWEPNSQTGFARKVDCL
jgi:hypothetical protein